MEKRLYKFSELTKLGVSQEYLRLWRKEDSGFPKPIRGKIYDIKAIEAYLDKLSGLTSLSEPDYESMFREDLNGEYKGGLPYNPHP